VHDAAREPQDLKHVSVQLAAVPHGPIGRRGMPAEHKAIPTVRSGVDIVAIIGPVAFAQPSRVSIVGVIDDHIRRVIGIFLAVLRQHIENLERTTCGRNDAGIDNDPFADQKFLAFQLMVEFVQQALEDSAHNQALTETADRGGVRHLVVVQGKAHESDKGQAIAQGLFHRHVVEGVPPLEQENFEHEQRGVDQVADGIGPPLELLAKHFFDRFPVDEAIDLVQEAVPVLAASGNTVGNNGLVGSTFAHGRHPSVLMGKIYINHLNLQYFVEVCRALVSNATAYRSTRRLKFCSWATRRSTFHRRRSV